MLMDAKTLAATFNLRLSAAESFVALRAEDSFKFIKQIQRVSAFDDEIYGFHISLQMKIEIVTTKGDARSRLEALVSFSPFKNQAYSIYKMEIK
jgi:hypothetical protein